MKKNILILLLFFVVNNICAQKITGTWEGDLGGDEFLQINLIEVGKNLCGYTFDQTYTNKSDYCKAYCNGTFNNASSIILLNGYSFMENSGGHVLMQLKLKVYREAGQLYLKGFCRTSASMMFDAGEPMEVTLKKTSNKPAMYTQTMKDCVKTYKEENKVIVIPKAPKPKPVAPKPAIKKIEAKPKVVTPKPIIKKPEPKPIVVPKKKDTIKPTIVKPKAIDSIKKKEIPTVVKPQSPIANIPLKTNGRTNKEISRIIVTSRKLKLEVFDNGTIDGDTISIYYNGKIIMDKKRLSVNPIVIDLDLDEKTNMHSVVMFAQNLGSIPPNTALIIVTTPERKRYELYASATYDQNAALVFEYKPN